MKKALLILFFLFYCSQVSAAPMFGEKQTFNQPDGSSVELSMYGDEFYMRAETPDGYTVMVDEDSGWIVYAELNNDGSGLISTGIPYVVDNSDSNESERTPFAQESIDSARTLKKRLIKRIRINDPQRNEIIEENKEALFNGEGPIDDLGNRVFEEQRALPQTENTSKFKGNIKSITLIFDFPDAPVSTSINDFRQSLNGASNSLKSYFKDISNGVFIVQNEVFGIYRAPRKFTYYDNLSYGKGIKELMLGALKEIDSKGFDFSKLSTNGSGQIKAINCLHSGKPKEWAQGMWFHSGHYSGFSADGVKTGRYCTGRAKTSTIETLKHENGHMIALWPDTYSYNDAGTGTWGLMGGWITSLPNPYFLYINGWLKLDNLFGAGGTQTMSSTNPHKALVYFNPNHSSEYFILRPYTKNLMYASNVPDEGLTIWRINENGSNSDYPKTKLLVDLIKVNNTVTENKKNVCFKKGRMDKFNDNTTPSAKWINGSKSKFKIYNISDVGNTMSFSMDGGVNDLCPNDPNKIVPGACGCGVSDKDSDGDGTPDCNDQCPSDKKKTKPGVCGCNAPDTDSDSDGTANCVDECPNDKNKTDAGFCGCGTPDVDTDGDKTLDCDDGCPKDKKKTSPGVCGCGIPDTDSDNDGIPDCKDSVDNGGGSDDEEEAPGTIGCFTQTIYIK